MDLYTGNPIRIDWENTGRAGTIAVTRIIEYLEYLEHYREHSEAKAADWTGSRQAKTRAASFIAPSSARRTRLESAKKSIGSMRTMGQVSRRNNRQRLESQTQPLTWEPPWPRYKAFLSASLPRSSGSLHGGSVMSKKVVQSRGPIFGVC